MAEIITCPVCARKLQVPDSFYGQMVQCPECAHKFVADPHATSVQTTPPAAAESAPVPSRQRRDDDDDFDDEYDNVRPLRRTETTHRGGMILAIGIIALVIPATAVICGPLAWILGNSDLAEIREGRMDPSGEAMVQAGRVLGMISTFFVVVVFLLFVSCMGIAFVNRR
jgi:hypothetical protein